MTWCGYSPAWVVGVVAVLPPRRDEQTVGEVVIPSPRAPVDDSPPQTRIEARLGWRSTTPTPPAETVSPPQRFGSDASDSVVLDALAWCSRRVDRRIRRAISSRGYARREVRLAPWERKVQRFLMGPWRDGR